jgi:hypothetical protein
LNNQASRPWCALLASVACVALLGPVAEAQQQTAPSSAPVKDVLKSWRRSALRTPRPNSRGCFRTQYPDVTWAATSCRTPPAIPFRPHHGGAGRLQTVGDGTDFSAQIPGTAASMEGSFDSVSGVTSESGAGVANAYSLQLNSEFFPTTTCAGGQAGCNGWEQFIFANLASTSESVAFIQYWMLGYGASCPHGWTSEEGTDCFRNSSDGVVVPIQTIASLGQITLTGVAPSGPTDDSVTVSIGGTLYSVMGDANFPDFAQHWNTSEFNVFGPGDSSQAVFNTGSTITVRTEVDSGTAAPACIAAGFTAETNNLTLTTPAVVPQDSASPSIVFRQSNPGGATPATCASLQAAQTDSGDSGDSDGPMPWWALAALGAVIAGIAGRRLNRI